MYATEYHTSLEDDRLRKRLLSNMPKGTEVWIRAELLTSGSKAASVEFMTSDDQKNHASIYHRDIYVTGLTEFNQSCEKERRELYNDEE
jgi:hypothetical protein